MKLYIAPYDGSHIWTSTRRDHECDALRDGHADRLVLLPRPDENKNGIFSDKDQKYVRDGLRTAYGDDYKKSLAGELVVTNEENPGEYMKLIGLEHNATDDELRDAQSYTMYLNAWMQQKCLPDSICGSFGHLQVRHVWDHHGADTKWVDARWIEPILRSQRVTMIQCYPWGSPDGMKYWTTKHCNLARSLMRDDGILIPTISPWHWSRRRFTSEEEQRKNIEGIAAANQPVDGTCVWFDWHTLTKQGYSVQQINEVVSRDVALCREIIG